MLRRELFAIPGRFTRGAGTTYLRLPPWPNLITIVLPKVQELPPAPAGAMQCPPGPHEKVEPTGKWTLCSAGA